MTQMFGCRCPGSRKRALPASREQAPNRWVRLARIVRFFRSADAAVCARYGHALSSNCLQTLAREDERSEQRTNTRHDALRAFQHFVSSGDIAVQSLASPERIERLFARLIDKAIVTRIRIVIQHMGHEHLLGP